MGPQETFEESKYLLLEEFLEDPLLFVAYRYVLMRAQSGSMFADPQVPTAPACYGDSLMETLLELFVPTLEEITGKRLHPTYSYMRLYRKDDILERHRDRASCEISMTLCLGFDMGDLGEDHLWPMFVKTEDQEAGVPIDCRPGDAILYKGCEVEHWREPFQGNHQAQVFLHFVDQDGPYADHKWDKRERLGEVRADTVNKRAE